MKMVQERRRCLLISTKNIFGLLVFIFFRGTLTTGNEDIPWCDKHLSKLRKDVQDWQKRCLTETGQEIDSSCCKAEKDYFEERMRMHTEMCFYSGNFRCERILNELIYDSIVHNLWIDSPTISSFFFSLSNSMVRLMLSSNVNNTKNCSVFWFCRLIILLLTVKKDLCFPLEKIYRS